jgi:hypothetical protein
VIRVSGAVFADAAVFAKGGNLLRFGHFGSAPITRFLCGDCGFLEEWIENPADLAKIRAAAGIDVVARQQAQGSDLPQAKAKKRARPWWRIAAAALVVGVMVGSRLLGESFTERLPGEVMLPGFVSYATRAEVLASLGRDVTLHVVEDSPQMADGRPPFAIFTVEAQPMSCFGQRGVLRWSFFNDRLMEVRFFADEPDALFAALREQGLWLGVGEELERGSVRITAGQDATSRRCVVWRDERLAGQHRRWILRYA